MGNCFSDGNMSSEQLYLDIHNKNICYLLKSDIVIDEHLNQIDLDNRLGISLIIPIRSITRHYEELINRCKFIDNSQYYYPIDDLHITIFDFIQGSERYSKSVEKEEQFIKINNFVLSKFTSFYILLKGIVFCRSALLIKGYDDNVLIGIRNFLRSELESHNIENDERYSSESAHIAFCRFKTQLTNPYGFLSILEHYQEFDFGKESIKEIELVEHDWYNKTNKKRVIKRYQISQKNNFP